MLLSLVQTSNRIDGAMDSVADPFLPFVLACAKSRVWKVRRFEAIAWRLVDSEMQIRDAAGDALTGLVSPAEVATTALSLLAGVENCVENEVRCLLAGAPLALTPLFVSCTVVSFKLPVFLRPQLLSQQTSSFLVGLHLPFPLLG